MTNYELTLVLSAKSKAKEKSIKEKIGKLVELLKGKLGKTETWGEIELAYKIAKEKSGYYLFFEIELDGENVKKLDDKLRTEDEIIRYLLIKKE